MGSRSSFKNVHAGDFTFVDGGKTFRSIGGFDNVKILVKERGSVKAPEFSHTAGRIYAIVQDGKYCNKGIPISEKEQALVNEIKERFGLQ